MTRGEDEVEITEMQDPRRKYLDTKTGAVRVGKSVKFEAFVLSLRQLCRDHGVQLTTDSYDGLQVWDLGEGDELIRVPTIEDHTKP